MMKLIGIHTLLSDGY